MRSPRHHQFIRYHELFGRVDAWIKGRLWLQVLIGLAAGAGVGLLLGPDLALIPRESAEVIGTWLALPGRLFLGLIGMVLVPLVVCSIILGIGGAASGEQLRQIGGRLALFIITGTAIAATLGIALAQYIRPGSYVLSRVMPSPMLRPDPNADASEPLQELTEQVPQFIANLIPQNVFASVVDQEMLAIVIFSIFIGVAFVTAGHREALEPLRKLFEALLEISMTVVKWAMFLTPYAVFGLIAQLTAQTGVTTLIGMGVYVLTVLAGLFILLLLFYLAAAVLGGISPLKFARAVAPNQLLAFSTSSSAAVIPVSIKTAVEKLGVPQGVAGLVIPLGATVNMAGSALYQSIALIFLAQLSGMYLSTPELALITLTVVAASIGAPGTPGVGIVILATIAGDFGISTAGLVLIMGVDRILDMSRTVVNVTGDLAACRVLRGFNNHPVTPPPAPPSPPGSA